jgi:hypothetical protein
MYIASIPNRNSPPAILLRQAYRENGKAKNRPQKERKLGWVKQGWKARGRGAKDQQIGQGRDLSFIYIYERRRGQKKEAATAASVLPATAD